MFQYIFNPSHDLKKKSIFDILLSNVMSDSHRTHSRPKNRSQTYFTASTQTGTNAVIKNVWSRPYNDSIDSSNDATMRAGDHSCVWRRNGVVWLHLNFEDTCFSLIKYIACDCFLLDWIVTRQNKFICINISMSHCAFDYCSLIWMELE